MEHPAAVEALAEEFSWAGADITQTFTYYSHTGVGTPEDCTLTVSATHYGEFDHFFWKKLPGIFLNKFLAKIEIANSPYVVGIQRGAVTSDYILTVSRDQPGQL